MVEITTPEFGRLSYPNEAGGRVDFVDNSFEIGIHAHGLRLIWSRAASCPCQISSSVEQPEPNCVLCNATGYFYYGPRTPQDLSTEKLDSVQRLLFKRSPGFLIRGIMQSLGKSTTDKDRAGVWESGQSSVTVVAENKLYFRDRLIALDTDTLYREVATMPAPPAKVLPLRYLIHGGVLLCRSVSRVYRPEADFVVRDGALVFVGATPAAGERISVAYNMFLTYAVTSLAHVARQQNNKSIAGLQVSPEGAIQKLPLMAQVQMEFIPHITTGGAYDG